MWGGTQRDDDDELSDDPDEIFRDVADDEDDEDAEGASGSDVPKRPRRSWTTRRAGAQRVARNAGCAVCAEALQTRQRQRAAQDRAQGVRWERRGCAWSAGVCV